MNETDKKWLSILAIVVAAFLLLNLTASSRMMPSTKLSA